MKLYDFDGMFDEKLSRYISENSGKHKESEWEDIIPALYKKFGDTFIPSVGCTPREYYSKMSDDELIKCLSAHLKKGVPVSEFLCNAIEDRKLQERLLPLLRASEDERDYAINLIGSDERAFSAYMDFIEGDYDEELKNRCADLIKEKADAVTERVLGNYKKGVEKELMLEILSRSVIKRDEIFDILLNEFRGDPENVPMHAGYLAAYADERALPYLLDKIDEEGITFVEYQELKYAIEALGGEYNKERDFSSDPYYNIIKEHSVNAADIFEAFGGGKN